MSLGQTTSAPASTCETAVRASSSSEASLSISLAAQDAAVAVRGVLAQADVGEQEQLGEARPERAERLLDDPVRDPRARALVVLLLRDAEEDHRLDARREAAPRTRARRRRRCRRDIARQRIVAAAPRARRRAASRGRRARASSRARGRAGRPCGAGGAAGLPGNDAHSPKGTGWSARRDRAAGRRFSAPPATGSTSTGIGAAARPGSNVTRSEKNSQTARADGEQRQRDQRADQARRCSLPASSPKITSSGCSRSALPITFGTTMWPSSWWMPRKSSDDPDRPRTDGRRARRSPAGSRRATGRGTAAPRSAPPTPPNRRA